MSIEFLLVIPLNHIYFSSFVSSVNKRRQPFLVLHSFSLSGMTLVAAKTRGCQSLVRVWSVQTHSPTCSLHAMFRANSKLDKQCKEIYPACKTARLYSLPNWIIDVRPSIGEPRMYESHDCMRATVSKSRTWPSVIARASLVSLLPQRRRVSKGDEASPLVHYTRHFRK